MSRYESSYDANPYLPDLPVVDWSSIGHEAPRIIPFDYKGPSAPLPEADIVVMTWTVAEWSAFDHVFVDSRVPRGPNSSTEWRDSWKLYARDAMKVPKSPDLWGYYMLVGIKNKSGEEKKVIVFKAEAHLAHAPYSEGLVKMTQLICEDAKPSQLYSIGTSGGARITENLGDVNVTNAGFAKMKKEQNAQYNDKSVQGKFYPPFTLVPEVQKLFMPLSKVLDKDELYHLIYQLHKKTSESKDLWYEDLVNAPLSPDNTGSPKALENKDIPLLTTDYYFIAQGDDTKQYSALEMDDTIIGIAAQEAGVDFCFVRNISDPIVADKAKDGTPIAQKVRSDWSGLIYNTAGLYTSFNGALTAWALIAGQ